LFPVLRDGSTDGSEDTDDGGKEDGTTTTKVEVATGKDRVRRCCTPEFIHLVVLLNLLFSRRPRRSPSLLSAYECCLKQNGKCHLRVGDPASKEGATNVRTGVDKTDQPAVLEISIYRMTDLFMGMVCSPVANLVGRVVVLTLTDAKFQRKAQVGAVGSA
jgi:hypothetical protein